LREGSPLPVYASAALAGADRGAVAGRILSRTRSPPPAQALCWKNGSLSGRSSLGGGSPQKSVRKPRSVPIDWLGSGPLSSTVIPAQDFRGNIRAGGLGLHPCVTSHFRKSRFRKFRELPGAACRSRVSPGASRHVPDREHGSSRSGLRGRHRSPPTDSTSAKSLPEIPRSPRGRRAGPACRPMPAAMIPIGKMDRPDRDSDAGIAK
jgi:hypothetical protein